MGYCPHTTFLRLSSQNELFLRPEDPTKTVLGGLGILVEVWKEGALHPDGHNDHNLPCQYGTILRVNVYTMPCILIHYDCAHVWTGCGNTTSGYPDSWTQIK